MSVEVSRLCKAYGGVDVLRSVTLTIDAGVTCLTAPSGGGKTTLLRILLGLEQPDSGAVTGLSSARLSAVFQESRLLERLSAAENLGFVLGGAYDAKKAGALLAELGLGDVGEKPAGDFSGGMKRRLALARALIVPFDFLALDEPFAGLDEENRARSAACIRTRAVGKIVLLAAHEPEGALDARIVRLEGARKF